MKQCSQSYQVRDWCISKRRCNLRLLSNTGSDFRILESLIDFKEQSKLLSIWLTLKMYLWHKVIWRIGELGTCKVEMLLKIICDQGSFILVHKSALKQNYQVVEKLVCFRTWLVYRHYDSLVLKTSKFLQFRHDDVRSQGVQTWGGFIQKENVRIWNQLKSNGHSLLFSSWNAFEKNPTDQRIQTFFEFQSFDQLFNFSPLFSFSVSVQFESCCEF